MVRRHGERTDRQALTEDTKRAILMDIWPAELENTSCIIGQSRLCRSDLVDVDDACCPAEGEHDGER